MERWWLQDDDSSDKMVDIAKKMASGWRCSWSNQQEME
jgi:hypothetical protein